MCEIFEPGEYYKVKKPEMTFERIGGYDEVKERLQEMVSLPLKHPETFESAGMTPPNGLLMWGPPNTSMNTFAEAAANAADSSYISSTAPQLLLDDHSIKHLFEDAENLAPVVVYIGEVDLLAPRREGESTLMPNTKEVASTDTTRAIFAEVDKIADRQDIVIVAGTNRPDYLDPALLRNGRLDRKVYVPAPDHDDRLAIFEMITKGNPLGEDVTPEKLAEMTRGYAPAEMVNIPREATLQAIKENPEGFEKVELRHFESALEKIKGTLPEDLVIRYEDVYKEECKHRYMY